MKAVEKCGIEFMTKLNHDLLNIKNLMVTWEKKLQGMITCRIRVLHVSSSKKHNVNYCSQHASILSFI